MTGGDATEEMSSSTLESAGWAQSGRSRRGGGSAGLPVAAAAGTLDCGGGELGGGLPVVAHHSRHFRGRIAARGEAEMPVRRIAVAQGGELRMAQWNSHYLSIDWVTHP